MLCDGLERARVFVVRFLLVVASGVSQINESFCLRSQDFYFFFSVIFLIIIIDLGRRKLRKAFFFFFVVVPGCNKPFYSFQNCNREKINGQRISK